MFDEFELVFEFVFVFELLDEDEGPSETVTVTVAPESTSEPEVGYVEMTLPFATVSEYSSLLYATKPRPSIVLFAPLQELPTTLGTVIDFLPVETM